MVAYSEHSIVSGKTKIVLSIWEPAEPEAVIVFVPASMLHPLCYEPLLRGFAEKGFAVVGLHPVGHGKSPRDVRRYSLTDIVQNARDAVSFAAERYQAPILAMGTSQGGTAVAALAAEDDRLMAVFSNNIMLSDMPDTIHITRMPKWLRRVYKPWLQYVKLAARLQPDMPYTINRYLGAARINLGSKELQSLFDDPLCLKNYPLYFLSSLLNTRFPGLTDGSIRCPLYLVTNRQDTLFVQEYSQKVFERLQAQHKEMVIFDTGGHMFMLTNHHEVCDTLASKIREAINHSF